MGEDADRRSQILAAAFEQFADHGFRGATIKSIARAARLQSPALIYWYFPTKEALFQSVIEKNLPFLRLMTDAAPLLERPPDEVLPTIARAYLSTAALPIAQRMVRLLVPEAMLRPDMAQPIASRLIGRVLGFLTTYLDHQIALGRLRPHDTRSGARAFMGMLIPQAIATLALPEIKVSGPTNEEHIATAVGIFLRGLAVEPGVISARAAPDQPVSPDRVHQG
jgi:TetR/AcrR family transcriptional regulator